MKKKELSFLQQDSITDVSRSEGEVLQDPMVVLLSRIKKHMRSAENSMASEGELLTEHLRMPDSSQREIGKTDQGRVGEFERVCIEITPAA